MNDEEKIKLFNDVFSPKKNEKILFLYDYPHDEIKDNIKWNDRREMVKEWYILFEKIGRQIGFESDILKFPATGVHNIQIPINIIDIIKKSNLITFFLLILNS